LLLDKHLPKSQFCPIHPFGQTHKYDPSVFMQDPLRQGDKLLVHSFMSEKTNQDNFQTKTCPRILNVLLISFKWRILDTKMPFCLNKHQRQVHRFV